MGRFRKILNNILPKRRFVLEVQLCCDGKCIGTHRVTFDAGFKKEAIEQLQKRLSVRVGDAKRYRGPEKKLPPPAGAPAPNQGNP
jgi:hypothetical protein